MTSGIYKLTFDPDNTYIGKSVDIERRWAEHAKSFERNTAANKMQRAFDMFGFPDAEILLECHPDHIDLLESIYISARKPTLNSAMPQVPDPRDIEVLCKSRKLLQQSTADHMAKIMDLESEVLKKTMYVDELTELITKIDRERTKQELKTELGRRLHVMQVEATSLGHRYDVLVSERDKYKALAEKPLWKRLLCM